MKLEEEERVMELKEEMMKLWELFLHGAAYLLDLLWGQRKGKTRLLKPLAAV